MGPSGRLPTYREIAGPDLSGIGAQVAAQHARVTARLAGVRYVVAVASGKGGVGKSFVTARLGEALAAAGLTVGILDADVNGPTIPRLTGAARPVLRVAGGVVEPFVTAAGVRVFSAEFLVAPGEPVRWHAPQGDAFVWRGTLEAQALREMLSDVAWGVLDVLLVDLPPGPGRLEDLSDLVPGLAGVLAVTIPSGEALDAVRRALALSRERGTRLLGIVENLTGHRCPSCGHEHAAFPGDAGAQLSAEFAVPILGRLPIDPPEQVVRDLGRAVWARLEHP